MGRVGRILVKGNRRVGGCGVRHVYEAAAAGERGSGLSIDRVLLKRRERVEVHPSTSLVLLLVK
eukprot:scaffold109322_cov30-Tisochrysis_lutea.AAC.1